MNLDEHTPNLYLPHIVRQALIANNGNTIDNADPSKIEVLFGKPVDEVRESVKKVFLEVPGDHLIDGYIRGIQRRIGKADEPLPDDPDELIDYVFNITGLVSVEDWADLLKKLGT